jgi:hypothetical protein
MIVDQALIGPAVPQKKRQVKIRDDAIIPTAVDRSAKFKAPESVQPTRRWTTTDDITKNVLSNRAITLAFLNTTQLDLRDHFMDHPVFKTLDT